MVVFALPLCSLMWLGKADTGELGARLAVAECARETGPDAR